MATLARTPRPRRSPPPLVLALALVLIAAAALRLYQIDWDRGQDLHPDELYIAKIVLVDRIHLSWPVDLAVLLDPARSGLNPRSADPETGLPREFPYGALPLFVTDLAAEGVSRLTGVDWHAGERVYLIGRALSALLDTATVLVVFVLGRRVFGRRVGLLGAAFAALAPMSIQLAHFFTTDSWLTFFVALCLLAATRAAERGAIHWFATAGVCFGLAMATKGSVFTLGGVLGAAAIYAGWRRAQGVRTAWAAITWAAGRSAVAAGAALLAFAVFEPYALLSPGIYLQSLATQAAIVRGAFDVPFTRVYVGTAPVLYQAEQVVRWGLGPVTGVLAIAGALLVLRRFRGEPAAGSWILLCWLFGYGLVVAVAEAKFLRYLAPLVPVFAVLAGVALDAAWAAVGRRWGRRAGATVGAAALAGAALWAMAFVSVYAAEHPRLAASRWLYANAPVGSALTAEYWDDSLPKPLAVGLDAGSRQFEKVTMDLYADRPPAEVADEIYGALARADYVVLSSNRVVDALARAPWRYAVQNRYYQALADGALGFERAANFRVVPSLGPLRFDDRAADESFVNYDHPAVTIYQKRALLGRPAYDELMAPAIAQAWSPTRQAPEPALQLDQPVGDLPMVADARWSAGLTGNSAAALLVWLVLLVVLQVAGWPLASLVMGRFADAGWGLTRLLTVAVAAYGVWLGASLRVWSFRAVWCWAAIAILAGAGWYAWRQRRRSGLWRFGPEQRRAAVGAEVVFWAVFALFLLYRWLNPDAWHPAWGGEKPMEFAHLNATLRSAHFPPYDPWYAGGYVNYYYYGLYLVAFLLKLTGIPSEIAFNLAQPTVIALLASAAYSVAATLGRAVTRGRVAAAGAGAVGALLMVGIGNLTGLSRLLDPARPDLGSGDFSYWTWRGSRAVDFTITEFPSFTGLYADLHAHVVALPLTVLAMALAWSLAATPWAAASGGAARFVFGLRFGLLVLVVGSLFPTNAWDVPTYGAVAVAALLAAGAGLTWPRRITAAAGGGALLGAVAYGVFLPYHRHYVAPFASVARVLEPSDAGQVFSHLGGLGVIVLVGMIAVFLPRAGGPRWLERAPGPVLVGLVLLAVARIAVADTRPVLADWLAVASVLLAGGLLGGVVWAAVGNRPGHRLLGQALVLVVVLAIALVAIAGWVVLAAGGLVAAGGAALWLLGGQAGTRFVGVLVLAAGGVAAGTELVVVVDDLYGGPWYRMNTVFKFYNQVWVLLALSGAALVAKLWVDAGVAGGSGGGASLGFVGGGSAAVPRPGVGVGSADRGAEQGANLRRGWARSGLVVVAAIIAVSLLYPLTATLPRLQQRFVPELGGGGLNGLDWMRVGSVPSAGGEEADDGRIRFAEDRAVIDWFNREVPGSPVIAEASIGPYRCNGSRISIGTGLPTIIGWERHLEQQRPGDDLAGRVEDVGRLYRSADPREKERILRRYDVDYVVVGELERRYPVADETCQATGSAAGVEAFEPMVGSTLEVAFAAGATRVYRVLPPVAAA